MNTKSRLSRRQAVNALTTAIVGAGLLIALAAPPARGLVLAPGGRGGPIGGPVAPPPPAPVPRPDDAAQNNPGGGNGLDPGNMLDQAAQGMPVYVDDSFSAVDKIRTAKLHAKQEQWQLAINEFQKIIDDSGQKLVYLNDGSYMSITDYVRQSLLQMPSVKSGMYDQLFGGKAKADIDLAIDKQDMAGLIKACDKYFPSTAAFNGLQKAAEWYFERGEFSSAARIWTQLLDHPMAKDKANLLFRAASAETLAHNHEMADKLRDRLGKEFPDASGSVGGKEVKLLDKVDELMKQPSWESAAASTDEWPAFGGGASRSALLHVNATIGARLWSSQFAPETPTAANTPVSEDMAIQQGYYGAVVEGATTLGSFPVLSDGKLFIHAGNRVMAISANAGTQLWSYPTKAEAATGSGSSAAEVRQQALLRARGLIPSTGRGSGHDSVAVYGDQVFALLTAGTNANPQMAYDVMIDEVGNPRAAGSGRLVCLSRDDGRELWSVSPNDIKLDTPGALTFVGTPTVTRQGVFIMGRRSSNQTFNQQYLVRMDRETGAVSWSCYLCSTSTTNAYNPYTGQMYTNAQCVPTIADDVVYMCTGQGADVAVDANAGRILWLRVVSNADNAAADNNGNFNGGIQQRRMLVQQQPVISSATTWRINPPVISGDRMIATDGGTLRVYDRWNGKLINTVKAGDIQLSSNGSFPRFDVLAGVADGHLILSGGNTVVSVDVGALDKKGMVFPSWNVTPALAEVGQPQGRPFLTDEAYYVPYEKKLVHVSLKNGAVDSWPWPKTEHDVPGKPGNLLVTSEQVVVVTDSEVAGYSKWETARDNRLAKIKDQPGNPEPCLDLAEISFRTNNNDFAHEYMKKAVDLANSGEATLANGKSLLKRIYQTNLNFAQQLLGKDDKELNADSRFYFEQCKASARDPEQQAEWRLRMAELSLKQSKPEEAATLYGEILADANLRAATYRDADQLEPAGATAQDRIAKLIKEKGKEVYKRFEDQAGGILAKARESHDLATFQQVIDAYPNSDAAVQSATELVAIDLQKKDWDKARHALWWLEPKVTGEAQAKAMADLVTVSIALQRYHTAAAWIGKGERNFKDFEFVSSASNGSAATFEDIRKLVAKSGVPEIDGKLPAWAGAAVATSDGAPFGKQIVDKNNLLTGSLLAPVETSTLYRQSGLVFLQSGQSLIVHDMAKGTDDKIGMPNGNDAILLGATAQRAILLQKDMAIGVDLAAKKVAWTKKLDAMAPVALPANPNNPNGRIVINGGAVNLGNNFGGQIVIQGGGQLIINGNVIQAQANPVVVVNGQIVPMNGIVNDGSGRAVGMQGVGDAETSRAMAILSLGSPNFTTARLINNKLVILAGNKLSAIDVTSGDNAWPQHASVPLPDGVPVGLAGNEDVVVAQVDGADNKSNFVVVDCDTGNPGKTIKFDGGVADWRAVGDDGSLYVVSQQMIAAYDLLDRNKTLPIWQHRGDLPTRFGSATQLTLDGLMIVDNNMNVTCLAQESGQKRWGDVGLGFEASGSTALRSAIDGDSVLYTSDRGAVFVHTMPSPDGRGQVERMTYSTTSNKLAPLMGMQVSDGEIVDLAVGQVVATASADAQQLVLHARKGGKLEAIIPLPPASGRIMNWQVVDGGLAVDLAVNRSGTNAGHEVHLWKIPTKASGQ